MRISPINNTYNSISRTPKFKANSDSEQDKTHRTLVDISEVCVGMWLLTDNKKVEFKDMVPKKEKLYEKIPRVFFTLGIACLAIDICVRLTALLDKDS